MMHEFSRSELVDIIDRCRAVLQIARLPKPVLDEYEQMELGVRRLLMALDVEQAGKKEGFC